MDELVDGLAKLVGVLREDDLKDPEIAGLAAQLIQILDPQPEAFPAELGEELAALPDKIDRFKAAAAKLGVIDPQKLRMLAESMKQAGLFKGDK